MVSELEDAEHKVPGIDQKSASLLGLPADYDVMAESIIDDEFDYHKGVSKLIVRETRLTEKETGPGQALVTKTEKDSKAYMNCGKRGPLAKDCLLRKLGCRSKSSNENSVCFKCCKPGHVARDRRSSDTKDKKRRIPR